MPTDPLRALLDDLSRSELRELARDTLELLGPRSFSRLVLPGAAHLRAFQPRDDSQLDLYSFDEGPLLDELETSTLALLHAPQDSQHVVKAHRLALIGAAQAITAATQQDEAAAWALLFGLARAWRIRNALHVARDPAARIALAAALRAMADMAACSTAKDEALLCLMRTSLTFAEAERPSELSTLFADALSAHVYQLNIEPFIDALTDHACPLEEASLFAQTAMLLFDDKGRLSDALLLHAPRSLDLAVLRVSALHELGRIDEARQAHRDAADHFGDAPELGALEARLY